MLKMFSPRAINYKKEEKKKRKIPGIKHCFLRVVKRIPKHYSLLLLPLIAIQRKKKVSLYCTSDIGPRGAKLDMAY